MQHTSMTDEKRKKAAPHIRVTALNLCYMYYQPTKQDNDGISFIKKHFRVINVIMSRAYIPNTKYSHRIGNEYVHTA